MEWAVLTQVPSHALARHGRLNLSDRDLVRRLRDRDGVMPARAPSHTKKGHCKYADRYPRGGCPWCRQQRAA